MISAIKAQRRMTVIRQRSINHNTVIHTPHPTKNSTPLYILPPGGLLGNERNGRVMHMQHLVDPIA